MAEDAAHSNRTLPSVTHLEMDTIPVASAPDLVRALGRAAWLPAWWPYALGHPRYLLLRRDGEKSRYIVWSANGTSGLVLASRGDGAPQSDRPLEPILDLERPGWRTSDGPEQWRIEMPDGEVLLLVGAASGDVRDQLVRSLRLVGTSTIS